jgi:hypothetical protein
MKRAEIVSRLKALVFYATDEMRVSDCDDVWAKDAQALVSAIQAINLLSDILDNLEGQGMLGEMITLMHRIGYSPEDFEDIGICSVQEAEEYIEYYSDQI